MHQHHSGGRQRYVFTFLSGVHPTDTASGGQTLIKNVPDIYIQPHIEYNFPSASVAYLDNLLQFIILPSHEYQEKNGRFIVLCDVLS